jgi:hypothetical protein
MSKRMRRADLASFAAALLIMFGANTAVYAAELTFDIRIERGRVAEPMRRIRVTQGDLVRLRWATDRPLVLHLHGYDIEKRLAAGAIGELDFTAAIPGRFPIHVHGGGHAHDDPPLAVVEVQPR